MSSSGYAAADTFGQSAAAPRLIDARTGITWVLGFGAIDANGVPAVVWSVFGTWAVAKSRLGSTWAQAKGAGYTWGQVKALVSA